MLLNILIGCVVFFVTNLSLLYACHLLARRFFSGLPDSARLVGIGVLYYGFIILILQALSPLHAISKTWVTVACLLVALACHFLWGTYRNLEADANPVRQWVRDGLASRWAALIIVCGFVVLLSLVRALLMPPLSWDSLTYHLTSAALWIKKGTLCTLQAPYQMQNAYFPINGELFAAWLILPFHTDLLVNTLNFPITLLGGVACYAIARELGLQRGDASFVPALICFASVIYAQITTQYVDNAAFAFCVASVLFTLRYLSKGHLCDGFLVLASAGILIGIKYSIIPVAGIIVIIIAIKTVLLTGYTGFFRKSGLMLSGVLIFALLGGRQYLVNAVEAKNPLYPFPMIMFNGMLEGKGVNIKEVWWMGGINELQDKREVKENIWIQEYKKFCQAYLAAGPKFVPLLLLAFIGLFIIPPLVPKPCWYALFFTWLIPITIFYTTDTAKAGMGVTGFTINTRYFSPYIALFTIQGVVVLKTILKQLKSFKLVFAALVGWDLIYVYKKQCWELELLYPYTTLLVFLMLIVWMIAAEKMKTLCRQGPIPLLSSWVAAGYRKRFAAYAMRFVLVVAALYLLQTYRDETRYFYYRSQTDYHDFPREFIDGWEFVDNCGEEKTIALASTWDPPGTKWFFYPLMGRWLQNDVTYVSAKYKWDVPVWLHRGLLEGDDLSIWLHNLKRQKVNYVFLQKPFGIEWEWVQARRNLFEPLFWDLNCAVYKYTEKK